MRFRVFVCERVCVYVTSSFSSHYRNNSHISIENYHFFISFSFDRNRDECVCCVNVADKICTWFFGLSVSKKTETKIENEIKKKKQNDFSLTMISWQRDTIVWNVEMSMMMLRNVCCFSVAVKRTHLWNVLYAECDSFSVVVSASNDFRNVKDVMRGGKLEICLLGEYLGMFRWYTELSFNQSTGTYALQSYRTLIFKAYRTPMCFSTAPALH